MIMVMSKRLLPVYDKPMIYYPLFTTVLAGIRDTLTIFGLEEILRFEHLLGDGIQLSVSLQYKMQPSLNELAQVFLLEEEFIGDDACAMELGDNIFYGNDFGKILCVAAGNAEQNDRAIVFSYYVNGIERFGIIELDEDGKVFPLRKNPSTPRVSTVSLACPPKGRVCRDL